MSTITFVMDLSAKGLVFDRKLIDGEVLAEFDKKFKVLQATEIKTSLSVTTYEFQNVLSQTVPCVGCRRSVERLYSAIMTNNYATLDPIKIRNGVLSVCDKYLQSSQLLCTLLYDHDSQLNVLLENQPRNKKNSRCNLHSLESFRTRPFSETWYETWDCMKQNCKEKIAVVEAHELHATLDEYLKKHKFCQECRTKVEKAYTLLMTETNPAKEKGYVSAIYNGIKRCLKDKHIHLPIKTDYIDDLIKRAEPEIIGSHSRHRERHAKTMEIAQEEVLTCIGMCMYLRLKRIQQCVKEEENACQVLAAVAVHSLCRSFDMAVENKRGVNLELIYDEISRDERQKEQRKELKKLKKRKKRNEKKQKEEEAMDDHDDDFHCDPELVSENCACSMDDHDHHHHHDLEDFEDSDNSDDSEKIVMCDGTIIDVALVPMGTNKNHQATVNGKVHHASNHDFIMENSRCASAEHLEVKVDEMSVTSCLSCHEIDGDCAQRSIDAGYSSETNHDGLSSNNNSSRTSSIASTPEGSEVACSDVCCKHVGNNDTFLTLEQMLVRAKSLISFLLNMK